LPHYSAAAAKPTQVATAQIAVQGEFGTIAKGQYPLAENLFCSHASGVHNAFGSARLSTCMTRFIDLCHIIPPLET
jgi:hypothetical protein